MSRLYTERLTLSYESHEIIRELHLQIPDGKITALVGRNGCGKSTLLKALARLLSPTHGGVFLDGKEIQHLPTREVAKQLAILSQSPTAPEGLTVEGLVRQGRYPHMNLFGKRSAEDDEIVNWALQATHMDEMRERDLAELSGGQRQRAWVAMALAQGTDLLLLDEPTTYLDMAHQLEVLELLEELNRKQGKTIVMVVHDLNHAARYAHHMIAVADGQVWSAGTPAEIMTPELLLDVFGVHAHIQIEEETGIPVCVPYKLAMAR